MQNSGRILLRILLLLIIGLIMVWSLAFYRSKQAYHQAETRLEAGRLINAVACFDRSIRWYTPLNPYVRLSAQRLWDIALQAEQKGDGRLALIALRTLCRGLYAAGHLWEPGKAWIYKCSAKIDELMAFAPNETETTKDTGTLDTSDGHAGQQARNPSTPWSIAVEIGFLGWIGSVIGWIMTASWGDGKPRLSPASVLGRGAVTLAFFSLWVLGMLKA